MRSARRFPSRPSAAAASPSVWQLLWAGGKSGGVLLSQVVAVIFLVFFMLCSGTLFKRKLVVLSGERLTQRKLTVEMLDEISGDRLVERAVREGQVRDVGLLERQLREQ